MNGPLRLAVVGCGSMSGVWIDVLIAEPDVEIVGLCDVIPGQAAARARQAGLEDALCTNDLRRLIDATHPDVVVDLTVPESHHHVTCVALERGCHVFGEKPLADTMEHAHEMVALAARKQRLYAVMQNRRYDPNIRRLQAFLDSGSVGALTTLNADFYLAPHFGGFREEMDHVLLLDMAIHHFDAARFITGADPVSVICHEWNPPGSWYRHGASAIAAFEMSNGSVFCYRGSWCANGLGTTWECDWRAVCTRGSARWDGADGFVAERVGTGDGFIAPCVPVEVRPNESADKTGGHTGCIREMLRCVRTGDVPETVGSDNIKSLAMVFGAIESARAGARVDLRDWVN